MKQRTLGISLSVLAVVLTVGLVLYYFGAPQAPADAAPSATTAVSADADPLADGEDSGATGTTSSGASAPGGASSLPTEAEDSSPLAIQIPGCVCHSDDPQLVEEHATYRMSECYGCHADGTPAMGQ
ncbi:MAG: hypothetical protein PF636_04290 [Actinomycetota bacterium]|jgi:hypothetical protein|nr:hypothetical protein [Actinomycetota bacterium]